MRGGVTVSGSRETLRVRVGVRASARLRDVMVGSQGAMAQDLPLEALQRLLVHVGADLRVVVGDAVEERGRDLPDALLALPLMGTHHPSVTHPEGRRWWCVAIAAMFWEQTRTPVE